MKAVFIVGASGAGKTTLAKNLEKHFLCFFGGQAVLTVNLDCANPFTETDVDICNLIALQEVMQEYELGPNGALLFAADFLLANLQWLYKQIERRATERDPSFILSKQTNLNLNVKDSCQLTLIIDLPGQMQLYLQSGSMQKVISEVSKKFNISSCLLEVFDASYIYQVNDFLSICMATLTTGINFSMPHISLLNKIDLLKGRKPGLGMLEEYFKVTSMVEMASELRLRPAPVLQSLEKVIDQFGRVSFAPGSAHIEDLTLYLIFHLERIFGTLQINMYSNSEFGKAMKPFLKDFATERLLNNLEAQLFQDEQFDLEAELAAIRAKTGKQQ